MTGRTASCLNCQSRGKKLFDHGRDPLETMKHRVTDTTLDLRSTSRDALSVIDRNNFTAALNNLSCKIVYLIKQEMRKTVLKVIELIETNTHKTIIWILYIIVNYIYHFCNF